MIITTPTLRKEVNGMKKFFALVLALCLMVPALVLADGLPVVKIGVFEPSSGDNGAGGKQEVLGVEYAHSQIGRASCRERV